MKLRVWLGLALLICAFAAAAGGTRLAVRKSIESSMLVTGSIEIEKDGSVGGHALDRADKLPQVVRELVAKAVPLLRFEPVVVDGAPVDARTKMSLRLIAKKLDDGQYNLRIGSANFGEPSAVKEEKLTIRGEMTPPHYPQSAVAAGIQGTVYLVLKVDRQGKVEELIDEQVNLIVLGNEQQMRQARSVLAKAAVAVARKWQFDVPTRGELADDGSWSIRVPVAFALCDDPSECSQQDRYGSWDTYVPGPKNRVSWISDEDNRQSPEAMVAGGVYPVGSGPRLVTPLTQG